MMHNFIKAGVAGIAAGMVSGKVAEWVNSTLKPDSEFAKKAAAYGTTFAVAGGTYVLADYLFKAVGK